MEGNNSQESEVIVIDSSDSSSGLGDNEYIVESIVEHKYTPRGVQYLIKWKGYQNEDNTWQNTQDLNCPDKLEAYWKEKDDLLKRDSMQKPYKIVERIFSDWSPDPTLESWDHMLHSVENITKNERDEFVFELKWHNGAITCHMSEDIRKKCPRTIIRFYESLAFPNE